ncbi:MAG TPA: phytanoyl-CoA dioxygenase family protein, partial [Dehalococcoidia bacterium]|nr:phytanoyl-CoA dioxygenase family protein [Dehalococcoidia bacterium]
MNRIDTARLSPDQQRQFRENGYYFPVPALTRAEAAAYRERLEAFESEQGDRGKPILRQRPHLVLTWVDELIRHPNLIAAVSSLLGPDLLVWGTSFFIKDAGDPGYVSWHQDAPYWGLDNDDTITAWVALAPSRPENGCMRVIPGSQSWARLPHHDTHAPANLLSRGQEIAVEVD